MLHAALVLTAALVSVFQRVGLQMFGGLGLELFMGKFHGRCVYGNRTSFEDAAKWLVIPEQMCDNGGFRDCAGGIGHTCYTVHSAEHPMRLCLGGHADLWQPTLWLCEL